MRASSLRLLFCVLLALAVAGCGGGGGSGGSSGPNGTTVTVTFVDGDVTAAAVQTGTGAFSPAVPQAGKLTFTVPNGITQYSIAYVCKGIFAERLKIDEFVIRATTQDTTAPTATCLIGTPTFTFGLLTGNVDATLIPGATVIDIQGNVGVFNQVNSAGGPFNATMPNGSNDVAFIVIGSSGILAIKVLRSQTVPGAVNGGNVTFGPEDQVTTQPLTVNNIPPGFTAPGLAASYVTATGTSFAVGKGSTYTAVPPAAVKESDVYLFSATSSNNPPPALATSGVGIIQTTTSGGGPVTITLPDAWSYSGPTPAKLPTFTFNYSGFSGMTTVQQGRIFWSSGGILNPTNNDIIVTVTSNFQNGANTITVPDLTSISGFFVPPSGTVGWEAQIFGGTVPFTFFPDFPYLVGVQSIQHHTLTLTGNESISFVDNLGSVTLP